MSRFPSPTLADRINDRIQELEDGFIGLGDEDTPFTVRTNSTLVASAHRLKQRRNAS
jgi:hypothetical protein